MIRYNWFFIVLTCILFFACKESPWEAEVPTYLLVDSFSFVTEGDEGSNSHEIRDVWVYDNNEFLGAYQLPAQIPILGTDNKEVVLYPGIRENGNSFYPDIYFLYEPDTFHLNPRESNEIQVHPKSRYDERTKFAFIENFESGNIFITSLTGEDSSHVNVVTDTVFEGNKSGMLQVTEDMTPAIVGTGDSYGPFFQDGIQAYLEMDFKTNVPLTVGYAGISYDGEQKDFLKVTLKPTQEWRKVYIEFSEEFSGDDIFLTRILLRADLDKRYIDAPSGQAYFDNVKLVHF